MKKSLVILLVAVILSATSFAQFRIGPKLGANIGKIEGSGFNEQFKLGYHLGVFAEIPLGKKFGIQPEILWNQINSDTASGFRSIYSNLDENVRNPQLNYLSIPLLLSYKPSKFLSLQAGPQYGILLNRNRTFIDNGREAFKSGDFSMLLGAQLNILSVRVYGRYMIGLNNINDLPNQDQWKTTGFQLGVGIGL